MELEQLNTRTTTCPHHGEFLGMGTTLPTLEGCRPVTRWSECPPCRDKREKDRADRARVEAERKAEREAAEVRNELRKRINESSIPSLFLAKRLSRYVADSPGQKKALRSEERRVGKEGVCPCRSRWSPNH